MIHVVLDTTVYRADPKREKAAFRALSRLASAQEVTIHIPEVVRREFISQQKEQYSQHLQILLREMRTLARCSLPDSLRDFLDATTDRVKSAGSQLETFSEQEFGDWVKNVSAVVHPIADSHGERVVDAYFEGTPPFRRPKNRDDFPDGFIWQMILDLTRSYDPLYVISSDQGMLDACKDADRVEAFGGLGGFVSSTPFQEALQRHFASTNLVALLALVPNHVSFVPSAIENELVDALAGQTVQSCQILDDNHEATISMVGSPEDVVLDVNGAVDHGEGLFVVPVSLRVECLLDYAIFKGDFYAIPDEMSSQIGISELNDHYYGAEEYFELQVEGLLSFEVDAVALKSSDLGEDDLTDILQNANVSVDSITTVEVADDYS